MKKLLNAAAVFLWRHRHFWQQTIGL